MTKYRMKFFVVSFFFLLIAFTAISQPAQVELRKSISQYGITWEFDKPMQTGQFVTGDWWVVGPATIVKITPEPGPVAVDKTDIKINHWNDTSLKTDTVMRNGSAIVLKAGYKQSYDSRAGAFDLSGCVKLPLKLESNRSLISSISNTSLPVDNFCKNILWEGEYKCQNVMKTAAVLTCLDAVPPADAFRPPYVGTAKPIFLARDIHWDFLPQLQPAGDVPSWEEFERYFQRPWIDHLMSWSQQELVPNENGPNYGREHARLVSIASLMLCLDVPRERKEKLAIELIQRGIDLYGIAMNGGYWNEGGGHSSGRKWPILFASILLGNPKLTELPETAFFQEDTQTYYGKGWFGQTALWQMIMHHGKRDTYEEKSPDQWEKWDKTSESYRICCNAVAWTGTALAARYMKAIKLWGHDAHFDYIERWMREDDPYQESRGDRKRPDGETKTFDPFVTAMWKAHRKNAPEQEMSGIHRKWVWQGNKGVWIPNVKNIGLAQRIIENVRNETIAKADQMLREKPVTVTDSSCKRSAGGKNDFYSEGDYWWPDPANPTAPYIQKDGQTNPENFVDHRLAMIRLSEISATLTSAWILTGKQRYADQVLKHLNAWLVAPETRMNPNMLYAQAIWGRFTGRGIGLIDAYHFVEVVRSVKVLESNKGLSPEQLQPVKAWFSEFLNWMTTHQYGIDEMNAKNNHGTCWAVTAAAMADLTENKEILKMCTDRFKTVFLPSQMADDGSFPLELRRTKPYGYSLFNIDAMSNLAEILSTPKDNLWEFSTPDGKNLKKGMEYIYPFIADKSKWPFAKDIYIWEEWPVRQSSLLFSGLAYQNEEYISTFLRLPSNPTHPEVIRNVPVRHPVIWLVKPLPNPLPRRGSLESPIPQPSTK